MTEKTGARVFVVEDDPNISSLIREIIALGPHIIVDEVYWVATAMNAIATLGDLGVQAVTIDQDVFGGDIVKAGFIREVRHLHPKIKLIGLSCCPMTQSVDYDLGKKRICELNDVISRLTS